MFKSNLERGLLLCFPGRFLSSNVYLVVVEGEAVAIDCGMFWDANRALKYLIENDLTLKYILLTHSHFDHVMGMSRLQGLGGNETRVVAHIRSKRGNIKVKDGDVINAIDNQLSFMVIYTGLHRADHVWYYEKNNRLLFVGDYLATPRELSILKERHRAEPRIVLPGHGKPVRASGYY